MGGISSSARLVPPSLANVKHMNTFTEYPLCSLSQITEAYQYYRQSHEYQHHIPTLTLQGFEEIFGQLFPDPAQHFYALQQSTTGSVGYVVILDIFYIFILFCDASNEEKFRFLCNMNHDLDLNNLRIDALQLMIFRLLQAMTLVFKSPPPSSDSTISTSAVSSLPTRDEVYLFLDSSIKQFQERNRVANQNNPYYSITSTSNDDTLYPVQKPFTFHDFWQWCQDVNQISIYLDAIESICSLIIASVDRSHKGRQYMILRNSFFNFSLKTKSSSIIDNNSSTGGGNMLQSTLQNVMKLIQEQESLNLTYYALHYRHPLWKYTLQDMVIEHWFDDMHTHTTLETKVFTSLEHMILSHRHIMPIFVPQGYNPLNPTGTQTVIPGLTSGGHRFSTAITPGSNRSSISMTPLTTAHGNTHARGSISTFTPKGANPNPNPFSDQAFTPSATPSNTHHRTSSLAKGATPNQSTASLNSDAQPMQHPVHRMELLSIIDFATILSWVVICMPMFVLDSYRQQEEEKEVVRNKRASFDLSTSKKRSTALILASLRAANPLANKEEEEAEEEEEEDNEDGEGGIKEGDEEDKEDGEEGNGDGEEGEKGEDGDTPKIVIPSMIRFKQRHKNVNTFRNQWQTVGHVIANSPLLNIFQAETYAHLHRRYDTSSSFHHVYYINQPIYNIIALLANGVRYVPIGINNRNHGSAIVSSPNKLLHIVEPFEIAGFLFEHFDEFFNLSHHSLTYQQHRSHKQKADEEEHSGQPSPFNGTTSHEPFRYATQPPSPNKPQAAGSKKPFGATDTATGTEPEEATPQFMNKTIYQSGFMRKPCCIPSKYNIGTALFLLLQSKLDAAVIVNEQNKVCSVLSVQIIQKLWWSWKKQHLPMTTMTLQDLKHDYHHDAYHYLYGSAKNESYLSNQPQHKHKYGNIPAADLYNYSLFSALMNPLAHGDVIGLEYQDYDEYVNAPMPQADLLSMKLLHGRAHHLNQPSLTSVTTMSTDDDDSSLATESRLNQSSTVTASTKQSALPTQGGFTARPPATGPNPGGINGRLGAFRNRIPGRGGGVIGGIHLNQTIKDKQREESKAKAYKSRRMEQWFHTHKVITPNDSIRTALCVMNQSRLACVYVVNTNGEPVGVVTLQDICKYLIQSEARSKSIHSDIQNRDNHKMVRIISKAQNPEIK